MAGGGGLYAYQYSNEACCLSHPCRIVQQERNQVELWSGRAEGEDA